MLSSREAIIGAEKNVLSAESDGQGRQLKTFLHNSTKVLLQNRR